MRHVLITMHYVIDYSDVVMSLMICWDVDYSKDDTDGGEDEDDVDISVNVDA